MTVTISPLGSHLLARTMFAVVLAGTALLLPAVVSAQDRAWMDPTLLAAAKKEGKITAYGSMNEEEALPVFKVFEGATGIPVEYVRNSDTALMSRITVEQRANKQSWDVLQTTAVNKLPTAWLAQFDPSEAKNLQPQAKDPDRRWYGVYANYNSPAYNTTHVKKEDLPKTLEDFVKKTEWKGRVAIDFSDNEWLRAVIQHYGDDKGRALVKEIVQKLDVKVVKGHLALARSVGAGEYWLSLNNYVMLSSNVQLAGGPIEIFPLDPVVLFVSAVAVNAKAKNPNAARLVANFMLSRDGQAHLAKFGRLPTRGDVVASPPGILERLNSKTIVATVFKAEDERKWRDTFNALFKPR